MCHLSIELDQAVHPVGPILGVLEDTGFYLRSIRVVPSTGTRRVDVCLSLGGGSKHDLQALIADVRKLPGVLSTHNTIPPV